MSQSAVMLALLALTLQGPCLDPGCLDQTPPEPPNLTDDQPPLLPDLPTPTIEETPLPTAPIPETALLDTLLDATLPTPAHTAPPRPDPTLDASPTSTLDPSSPQPPSTPTPDTQAPPTTPLVAGKPAPNEHAPRAQTTSVQGTPLEEVALDRAIATALATLVLIGLYHRLNKRTALKHPTRQRVLSLLEDTGGGLTTTQLAERLNVTYRTARHHVTKLQTFGLVCQINTNGPEAWALPSQAPHAKPPLPEPQRRILHTLLREGSLHLSAIARRLGIAKATAKHRLDILLESELIRDERVGPLRCFSLTPEGETRCRSGSR